MAKCSVCQKVKGKRQCQAFTGVVCSACCGSSRREEVCAGCSFYKTAAETRRYDKAPYFSTQQMADDNALQDDCNVIEGALCGFDSVKGMALNDKCCKIVLERLLDRYSFGDQTLSFTNTLEKEGFEFMEAVIHEDLPGLEPAYLGLLIATVYRSIKRHADGNYGKRMYLDFIHQYVGIRVATGARVIRYPGGLTGATPLSHAVPD